VVVVVVVVVVVMVVVVLVLGCATVRPFFSPYYIRGSSLKKICGKTVLDILYHKTK
jgi:hypothetical protein